MGQLRGKIFILLSCRVINLLLLNANQQVYITVNEDCID